MATSDSTSSEKAPVPDTSFITGLFSNKVISTTDANIVRLQRTLSTSAGTDTVLTLVGYSMYLVHSQLARLQNLNLRALATRLAFNASKSGALNPGETIIASFPLPTAMARLEDAMAFTKGIAGMCSDFRAFTRLWGLLNVWSGVKRIYLNPPQDSLLKALAWAQLSATTTYLVFENGYYLAGKGVLRGWPAEKQKRVAMTSLRAFLVMVGLEFVRLARSRQLRVEKAALGEETEDKVKRVQEESVWWRTAYVYAAYAPLSVHWAIDGGVLSDSWVGLLMSIVGWIQFKAAWKQAA